MAKYINPPKTLKELTKQDVKDFIQATEEIFPKDIFQEGLNRPLNEAYTTFDGIYHWSTNQDFSTYITTLTETNSVAAANSTLWPVSHS